MTTAQAHISLLGVRVDDVTIDEALDRITAFVQARGPHHVVTVNPEFVMAAQHNHTFAEVLRKADLAVPDGVGLQIAAKWLGQPLRGRVAGVELCERIAELSAKHGWRLFLLGAAPGVADEAAAVLHRRFSGLVVAGTYAGSPHREDDDNIQAIIAAARPDVLLVAYGAPAQDLWIARNQSVLQVPVAVGVGGTFDYLSGRVVRAPQWMRHLGLEWLFRLVRQPWRWKRIWTAVVQFPVAVWRAERGRKSSKGL